MRTAKLFIATAVLLPTAALAQSSGRSVLLPPNAIDRATASTDQRQADARRAADADRINAEISERNSAPNTGQVPQSTMTDSAGGFSTSQEIGAPVTPAPTPPRT